MVVKVLEIYRERQLPLTTLAPGYQTDGSGAPDCVAGVKAAKNQP